MCVDLLCLKRMELEHGNDEQRGVYFIFTLESHSQSFLIYLQSLQVRKATTQRNPFKILDTQPEQTLCNLNLIGPRMELTKEEG